MGNELTRSSSGNIQPQSSQLAEHLWTDPGLKSGIKCARTILHFKKKKRKAGGEWMVQNYPKILTGEDKATTTAWLVMWRLILFLPYATVTID